MRFVRIPSAGCPLLCRVYGDITGVQFSGSCFLKMATFASVIERGGDWKHIKCSRDELRLDVTLASGQSFRLDSCCLIL